MNNNSIPKNEMLLQALHYRQQWGFSVFPVGKDKVPLIKWDAYQEQLPSEEEMRRWWQQSPNANIGGATGAVSGIVVVDVEKGGDVTGLPPTVISRTGGGGWHFFYKHPGGVVKNSVQKIREKMDIRGDGGYVVLPPSLHQSGQRYQWEVSPEDSEFVELPQWILEESKGAKNINWEELLSSEKIKGFRTDTATQIAGKVLHHLPPELWEIVGWATLLRWNQQQAKPPLEEKELRTTWESIKKREYEKRILKNENINEQFTPISLAELMAKEFGDTMWAIEKLVPLEGITAISGAPSSCKTWLILEMTLKIAAGDILFDKFPTTQSGVLIIDEENGEKLLQRRLKKMLQNYALPIYFLSWKGVRITKVAVEKIIRFTQENNIQVIVFDSLIRIHEADENDASKMAEVFRHIKELNKNGLTVIFTHHNRKQGFFRGEPSQNMRGSSDILASVDCHLALEKKRDEGFVIVHQTKLRQDEEIDSFKLGIMTDENTFGFEYFGEVDMAQTKKGDCKKAIKETLEREEKPMYKKELFETLKNGGFEVGYSTFKNAYKEMVETGELYEKRGERNKIFCSLELFGSNGQNALSL